MSRIDDDREADKAAQRLIQAKLLEQKKSKDKVAQDSNFAKLVGQQKEQSQKTEKDMSTRSAIAHLIEHSETDAKAEAAHADSSQADHQQQAKEGDARAFRSRMGMKSMGEKSLGERLMTGARADGQRSGDVKQSSERNNANASAGRSADQSAQAKGTSGRASDAKAARETLAARHEASDKAGEAAAEGASSASSDKGDIKTDADKGGQGGQQQGGGDKKGGEVPAGFRFNPALMAPVPVAQKNTTQGSDRLRRIASEIAQKIVERVRVGTNAAGNAEFQIDLRSNVLSGLQVKVSAKNGRISAVFSGSDRDVLKMLQEQEEALKGALSSRGLQLENFKVEAKA